MSEQIEIIDLSHDGRGVGRLAPQGSADRGKTCFISGALPSETVRWQRTNSKRSFDEGRLVDIVVPSPQRVEPGCVYFSQCGGCELQHLHADAQLAWKQQQLGALFARAGLAVGQWMPPLDAGAWNYRRRTRLAVAYGKGGQTFIGFRGRGSNQVVDINHCDVLDMRLSQLIPDLKASLPLFKNKGLTELELSAGDEQLAVCLTLKSAVDKEELDSLGFRLSGVSVWQKLPGKPPEPIANPATLRTRITNDIQMEFLPGQFVQINAAVNRLMVQQAIDWLDPQTDQCLLDLFCGGGNFSLAFAPLVKSVVGAEGSQELCNQGLRNAEISQLSNLEFRPVNLFEPNQFGRLGKDRFDLVLLDPPRAGAAEIMPWLKKQGPDRLLYVSCHPATMVRDLEMLSPGYRIEKVGAMNMFPHTTHLEAMALLIKKG